MNYKNIVIPYLTDEIIEKQTNIFRRNFWDETIPVEIESIIEFGLKLKISPTKGMMNECGMDAFITADWQLIYVDYDKYMDERYKNRLRFSLAHEIGHFVLHKKIYKQLNITILKDVYRFYEEISEREYNKLEIQANRFADYLLIPRGRLAIERNKELRKLKESNSFNLEKMDRQTLNSYLANPLSHIFGVSEEATEIALNRLKE